MEFHENLSSGSRFVSREQKDGRTSDIAKLIVIFCNFANGPTNKSKCLDYKQKYLLFFRFAVKYC